jgi:hypothetical protein
MLDEFLGFFEKGGFAGQSGRWHVARGCEGVELFEVLSCPISPMFECVCGVLLFVCVFGPSRLVWW